MCVVSFVGDGFSEWYKQKPYTVKIITTGNPPEEKPLATAEQIEELRKELLLVKELLKKAIKYDEDNGEPNCEMEEKVELLKKIADAVGVDIDDVFSQVKHLF
jgi:DNA-binding XRE family transcriptional regulator